MTTPILSLKGVNKSFGPIDVLHDISLNVHAGEVLFEGSPDEIVDNPDVRRVYLGDSFSAA